MMMMMMMMMTPLEPTQQQCQNSTRTRKNRSVVKRKSRS
jgi:hypothetical protein